MKRRSERGFTIVELLIVMVIMGILVTLAIPKFDLVFTKNKLRASTSGVTSALYLSRMKAVNDGQDYGVQFGSGSYFVVRDPLNTGQKVGETNLLEDGVMFGTNTFIDSLVIFNSLGQLKESCLPSGDLSGYIGLSDALGDSTSILVTFLTGRIRETNR